MADSPAMYLLVGVIGAAIGAVGGYLFNNIKHGYPLVYRGRANRAYIGENYQTVPWSGVTPHYGRNHLPESYVGQVGQGRSYIVSTEPNYTPSSIGYW